MTAKMLKITMPTEELREWTIPPTPKAVSRLRLAARMEDESCAARLPGTGQGAFPHSCYFSWSMHGLLCAKYLKLPQAAPEQGSWAGSSIFVFFATHHKKKRNA